MESRGGRPSARRLLRALNPDENALAELIAQAIIEEQLRVVRIEGPLPVIPRIKHEVAALPTSTEPRQIERTLCLRLVAGETKRGGKPYIIKFDNQPERKGQTRSDGLLVEKVPPGAQSARVRLEASDLGTDELLVNLDTLRDTSTLGGVQQRLCNAGFMSRPTGSLNDETRGALARFQLRHGLKVTGELNEGTRAKLEEEHGS